MSVYQFPEKEPESRVREFTIPEKLGVIAAVLGAGIFFSIATRGGADSDTAIAQHFKNINDRSGAEVVEYEPSINEMISSGLLIKTCGVRVAIEEVGNELDVTSRNGVQYPVADKQVGGYRAKPDFNDGNDFSQTFCK